MSDSQDIEVATTAIEPTKYQPDSKTRRYDRQLRLWASSGQSALESSRVLLLSASATSTSILKNLVLPGIGHFTILDPEAVQPEDAGNNFFLEGHESIGKSRAQEAVRLLRELNESVDGLADLSDIKQILSSNTSYLLSFTLVIAHNLPSTTLRKLSKFLWSDSTYPPLIVVRSAGFLADIYTQFHEHAIIDAHSETAPTLRIDQPFPALLEHATKLDFDGMDPTDHGHIPFVIILVRVLEEWKAAHEGKVPQTRAEKDAFKSQILSMKKKFDEENFDEAAAQSYRAWAKSTVPSEISALLTDKSLNALTASSPPFYLLLGALREFLSRPPHALPLTTTLPDMKSDTANYVHLQKLYKAQAEKEKREFKEILDTKGWVIDGPMVEEFVKNAHGVKLLRGKEYGMFEEDSERLANLLNIYPREIALHLSLSALSTYQSMNPRETPSEKDLRDIIRGMIKSGDGLTLPEEFDHTIGEILRTPTSDLPTSAAFLGGLVAQEAIKLITKQYVPLNGLCVVDLVGSWTGVVSADS